MQRWLRLLSGLFFFGIGISMMVRGNVGISPWDVLNQGVSLRTGLSFGLVIVLIGGLVLLSWKPLGQTFGIGTLLNVLLVGPSAQIGLWLLPEVHGVWLQWTMFAGGLCLLAIATGLYIGAGFGAGPRDGLMTGLHARTGAPIWLVRGSIESSVLLLGWWLGGNVGWGTLVFAALVGPLCGITLPMLRMRPAPSPAQS